MSGSPERPPAGRIAPLRVIKLGGSLLEWPGLVDGLRRWLSAQSRAVNVIVVGGGAIVEAVRTLDRTQSLGDEAAHWLAIRAMGVSAALVAKLLEEATIIESIRHVNCEVGLGPQILVVENFLRALEGTAHCLPQSWEVTSDSIAARVASVLEADELVVLKSALPAATTNLVELTGQGYVDSFFHKAAVELRVRFVNLRDVAFTEHRMPRLP